MTPHRDPAAALGGRAPTPGQRLLLAGALEPDRAAAEAWTRWQDAHDIDAIDTASFRLLPLVYGRIRREGATPPLLHRLKGVYRYCWFRQQLLAGQALPAIRTLGQAGIPLLLTKGAALSVTAYPEPAERFMNDIDVMVPPARAEEALGLLGELGWRSPYFPAERLRHYARSGVTNGVNLRRGESDIDLHWAALTGMRDVAPSWWEGARPLVWRETPLAAMGPADTLFHVAVSGLTSDDAHLTWIPDGVLLIRAEGERVDWDALVARAQRAGCTGVLGTALGYLAAEFGAAVPGRVLTALAATPVTRFERLEQRVYRRGSRDTVPERLARVLVRSVRYVSDRPERRADGAAPQRFTPRIDPFCVLRYLASKWQIGHWSEFPRTLATRLRGARW